MYKFVGILCVSAALSLTPAMAQSPSETLKQAKKRMNCTGSHMHCTGKQIKKTICYENGVCKLVSFFDKCYKCNPG